MSQRRIVNIRQDRVPRWLTVLAIASIAGLSIAAAVCAGFGEWWLFWLLGFATVSAVMLIGLVLFAWEFGGAKVVEAGACLQCGYSLKGLRASAACPECGCEQSDTLNGDE